VPPLEEADLTDTASWSHATGTNRNNEPTFATAVDIACCWMGTATFAYDAQGEPVSVDAQAAVADDVELNDVLTYEGQSYEVVTISTAKSVDKKLTRTELGLRRYKGAL